MYLRDILFREQRNDVQNHLGGLFDAFQRGEFELAVEVEAAGKDVGAGILGTVLSAKGGPGVVSLEGRHSKYQAH